MPLLPRPFFRAFLLLCAPLCGISAVAYAQNIDAAPDSAAFPPNSASALGARSGAARLLRFIDAEGRPLQGSFGDPAWETRGGGLFFTREFGGTRNIWRAFPDPRDRSRYPMWRALPVTQFEAPLFAAQPAPLRGDRALLMVSNAAKAPTAPRGTAQITQFDLKNPSLRGLTDEPNGATDAAPSPDGSSFAFTSLRDRISSVWVQNLGVESVSAGVQSAQRVANNARRPAWQNATTLLVESVDDASIYRLSKPWRANARPLRLAIGTQISANSDGSSLVLSGKTEGTTRLYLFSGDGSGLRGLASTENADSPALSGDGRWLAFSAPSPGQEKSQESRSLWIVPLEPGAVTSGIEIAASGAELLPPPAPMGTRPNSGQGGAPQGGDGASGVLGNGTKTRLNAPLAQIRGVARGPRGTVAILGTAMAQNARATLEIGEGATPRRWETRFITLPLAPGAPLLLWTPPVSARGIWSFRLLVSNDSGAAQSVFSVRLPLSPAPAASSNAVVKGMPAGGPLPSAPLPDLPAPPSLPRPAPLPPLLPAPPQSNSRPKGSDFNPVTPSAPVATPPVAAPPRPRPIFPLLQIPAPSSPLSAPDPMPASTPASTPIPSQVAPSANPVFSGVNRDAATFNVSNTLAEMKAGQVVNVTFWALNRGARVWDSGTAGRSTGAVRLVTRWVRFDNGNRRKWTLQWMKTPVSSGARTRWSFDLIAPSQPGRYKLIYGLVRIPSEDWEPPAYNAPQDTWPEEFAAIAFAVTVKP